MTLIDEFTRKCLAIRVARRINAIGVIETLADAMLYEGVPAVGQWPGNGRQGPAPVAVWAWHEELVN